MWNIETRTHLKEISISKSRIIGPTSVDELVKTNQFLAKSGPNTKWFDVSNDEYIKTVPGENKWNAIGKIIGPDEIIFAKAWDNEWMIVSTAVRTHEVKLTEINR